MNEPKPHRPKKDSPTRRTLQELRKLGWTAHVVERWNAFAHVRQDMFGCVDIVAIHPGAGILGVQACAAASHAARRTKSLDEPRLRTWLLAGGRFEIVSWAKQGLRGAVKRWVCRREEITLAMLVAERGKEAAENQVASLFEVR